MDLSANKLAKVMREEGLGPGKCILCLTGTANTVCLRSWHASNQHQITPTG